MPLNGTPGTPTYVEPGVFTGFILPFMCIGILGTEMKEVLGVRVHLTDAVVRLTEIIEIVAPKKI